MYTKFLLTILTVLSFMAVAYCKLAEPQTIEPFMGLSGFTGGLRRQSQLSDGKTCTDIFNTNTQNLLASTVVASPIGVPSTPLYSDGLKALTKVYDQQEPFESTDGLNNPGCLQEGYTGPDNFYTVPGTFQSALSPRFMNEGFGANITYNFPESKHMAAEPDNTMLLANNVESYQQQPQENYENVDTKFAQVHEAIPLPRTMDGPVREDLDGVQQVQGVAETVASTALRMVDRMIISTGTRNGNTNQCDMIRGDLPIVPSTASCGWFQSRYANPQYLCTGALQAVAGFTSPGMVALKLGATGDTTIGGGPLTTSATASSPAANFSDTTKKAAGNGLNPNMAVYTGFS